MPDSRKWLAGHLIRLVHSIYRPTVEEVAAEVKQIVFADGSTFGLDPVSHAGRDIRGWN